METWINVTSGQNKNTLPLCQMMLLPAGSSYSISCYISMCPGRRYLPDTCIDFSIPSVLTWKS